MTHLDTLKKLLLVLSALLAIFTLPGCPVVIKGYTFDMAGTKLIKPIDINDPNSEEETIYTAYCPAWAKFSEMYAEVTTHEDSKGNTVVLSIAPGNAGLNIVYTDEYQAHDIEDFWIMDEDGRGFLSGKIHSFEEGAATKEYPWAGIMVGVHQLGDAPQENEPQRYILGWSIKSGNHWHMAVAVRATKDYYWFPELVLPIVASHEMGHAFGLGENCDNNCVMNASRCKSILETDDEEEAKESIPTGFCESCKALIDWETDPR